jgi:hypothetical protein
LAAAALLVAALVAEGCVASDLPWVTAVGGVGAAATVVLGGPYVAGVGADGTAGDDPVEGGWPDPALPVLGPGATFGVDAADGEGAGTVGVAVVVVVVAAAAALAAAALADVWFEIASAVRVPWDIETPSSAVT